MKDEQAAEPPPGTPGSRALGAMESAVRRVRAAQGGPAKPPEAPPDRPMSEPPAQDRAVPAHPDRWAERWLITSIAVTAALVVVAAAALAASLTAGPSASTLGAGGFAAPSTPTTARHGTGRLIPRTSASTTTTTVAAASTPPTPNGPPVLNALDPASAAAGQGITVAGTNFLSDDGHIVATFNGQIAPTSCPAQNTCTVTVPPASGPTTAQVTITTAGGTSNALTFTYS